MLPRFCPQLESLTLLVTWCEPSSVESICELKYLKELHLLYCLDNIYELDPLIKNCPRLTKLDVDMKQIPGSLIQKIIEKAENHPKSVFEYTFPHDSFTVPNTIPKNLIFLVVNE